MSAGRLWMLRGVLTGYWLALATGAHWPDLDLGRQLGVENSIVALGLDKWVHVAAYVGLAVLAIAARPFQRLSVGRAAGEKQAAVWRWAVLAAVLVGYAAVDEAAQLLVPGRSVTLTDWLASCTGLALGFAGWGLVRWVAGGDPAEFVAHTRVVSALTALSRVFGLLRDRTLAWAFGFGATFDAFIVAFLVPNLFRRLFGEGALAAAFIPHYSKLRRRDPASAARLLRMVLGLTVAVLTAIVLVGMGVLAALLAAHALDARGMLTAKLTLITLWYMPLVCIAALLGAALQVHRKFAVPAASPVVLSLAIIGAALLGVYGFADQVGPRGRMLFVAGGVVLAGVVQAAWHALALRRARRSGPAEEEERGGEEAPADGAPEPEPVDERGALRGVVRQWVPTVLGLAVFQLNVLLDALIAMFFSGEPGATLSLAGVTAAYPLRVGDVAVVSMAQRLYDFPLGVFGVAVATAIYPQLSATADRARFSELVRQGLRLTVFIGLPASAGLLLVRGALAEVIYYEGGMLGAADAGRVAWVLCGYAPAVWAYSANLLLTRAFYARRNPQTPMRLGIGMVLLNLTLNLVLIWPLGPAGLAASTAVCAALQCALLLTLVRRHADAPLDRRVLSGWARVAVLTAAMAVAVGALTLRVDAAQLTWIKATGLLVTSVGAGMAVFLGGARLMRMAELSWLLRGTTRGDGAAR